MHRLTLLLVIAMYGCASHNFTVTLFRSGGLTGIKESYSVNSRGMGMKVIEMPGDTESRCWRLQVDRKIVSEMQALLRDSLESIAAIELHATGELTTAILFIMGTFIHEWPGLITADPVLGIS